MFFELEWTSSALKWLKFFTLLCKRSSIWHLNRHVLFKVRICGIQNNHRICIMQMQSQNIYLGKVVSKFVNSLKFCINIYNVSVDFWKNIFLINGSFFKDGRKLLSECLFVMVCSNSVQLTVSLKVTGTFIIVF